MKSPFTLLTKCRSLCLLLTLCAWTSNAQTLEQITNEAPGASNLYAWENKVFFAALTAEIEPEYFENEAWISDGTAGGTFVLKPGWIQNFSASRITANGDFLFYSVDWYDPHDPSFTQHSVLAKSDGTTTGTQLIYLEDAVELPAPFTDNDLGPASNLVSSGNAVFFTLNASITGTVNSYFDELWKSDGTVAGTVRVKDINPTETQDNISDLTVAGNSLYFLANDGVHGKELWKTDGTEAGTVMVKDISPGITSSSLVDLTTVGSVLYFANHESGNYSLWKSDGTEAGTQMIRDGFNPADGLEILGILGHTAYFTGHDGSSRKVWKTDGTLAGTVSIIDINNDFANFTPFGSTHFIFTHSTPETGTELWISDGTSAGTHLLVDLNPGTEGSSFPNALQNVPFKAAAEEVYFQLNNSLTGATELWKTDGTAAGTVAVYSDGNIAEFIVAGYTIYASVIDFDSGIQHLHALHFAPEKRTQTITFNPLPEKVIGQDDFDGGATASSGLPVVYTSSNEAVATIENGKIHIAGAGNATIIASQPGNDTYAAADPVQQTLTVHPAGTNSSVISLSGDLKFGEVISGLSLQKEFTISNTGSTDLTITGITFPQGYTGEPSSGVLAPSASVVVTITFSPTEAGAYNGDVVVESNASSGDNTIAVTGASMLITGREESPDATVKIYPNPGTGLYALEIAGPLQSVLLIDEMGREQTPVQLTPAGVNSYQLDIRHLNTGTYIIKLKCRDRVVAKRIIRTN